MLETLKIIWIKLKKILDIIFEKPEKTVKQPILPETKPEPEPVKKPAPIVIKEPVQKDIDPTGDPEITNPLSSITSFLWKPISDTDPKVAVAVVSADEIRSEDLRIEIADDVGNVIPGKTEKNPFSIGRANQLPGHKYGRINFKPGKTGKEYKKYAPIKVRFYVEIGGTKTYIKIGTLNEAIIKTPGKRHTLKDNKIVLDE